MSRNYDKIGRSDLIKECAERKITYPKKGYIRRDVLVALLEAHDEEQTVKTPPTPRARQPKLSILPTPFMESDSLAELLVVLDPPPEGPYHGKTKLVIGLPMDSDISISTSTALFTGVQNKESLSWKELTVDKSVPSGTFNTLIVVSPDVFDSVGGVFDPRRFSAVINTLSDKGEVRVIKYTDKRALRFKKALASKGYVSSSTQTIVIKGRDRSFDIFRKGVPGGLVFGEYKCSHEWEKRQTPVADTDDEFEEEEMVCVRPRGTYTNSNDVGITLFKKSSLPLESSLLLDTTVQTGITLDQFRKEIDSDEFIERFAQSTLDLLKHKLLFYKRKLTETKKEFSRVQKKVNTLKLKGVSQQVIKEMYPMFDFYAGFMVELEEMVGVILARMTGVNQADVRKNLLKALEDPVKGFASIIGRENIKNSLASQLYAFAKSYKTFTNSFNNICLMGPAGVGKTALAKVIGFVFSLTGILATDMIKITSRADLVAQYIGQTAPRTRGVLLETLEGVLFIDEAYQLTPQDTGRDFGSEAVTEIVNFLDKYIGMNIVIIAGYENLMTGRFFPSNEGLSRRFPYRMVLEKYNNSELTDILMQFIDRKIDTPLDGEVGDYLFSVISHFESEYGDEGVFSNQAGDMLNLGSSLVKAINGSYMVKWESGPGVLQGNLPILKNGFADYLHMKGLAMA